MLKNVCANALLVSLIAIVVWVPGAEARQTRLLDCPDTASDINECNANAYLTRVIIYGATGLIVGLSMTCCCPYFCCGRFCCDCCGGSRQAPGCCCPVKELPARYSGGTVARSRIWTLIGTLGITAAVGYGYVGGINLQTGLLDFGTAIKGIPAALNLLLSDIESRLIFQRYDITTDGFAQENLFTGSPIETAGISLRDTMQENINSKLGLYESVVNNGAIAALVIFAVPFVSMVVSFFSCCCRIRKVLPMAMAWLIFIFGGLVWVLHGGFAMGAVVLGDSCAEIHNVNNGRQSVLHVALDCNPAMFTDFLSAFSTLKSEKSTEACQSIAAGCYRSSMTAEQNAQVGSAYDCTVPISCGDVTTAALRDYVQNTMKIHANVEALPNAVSEGYTCDASVPTGQCSMAKCATNCLKSGARSQTGKIAMTVVNGLDIAFGVSSAAGTIGAQYASCSALMSFLMKPFDAPCFPIDRGLIFARQASGIEGLMAIIGLFCAVWGSKRNIDSDDYFQPLDDDSDTDAAATAASGGAGGAAAATTHEQKDHGGNEPKEEASHPNQPESSEDQPKPKTNKKYRTM